MDYFAGLDVSVKETSVCIVDDAGRIVKEVKVASELQALLKVLGKPTYRFKRIGLEAGPTGGLRAANSCKRCPWLRKLGYVRSLCLEARSKTKQTAAMAQRKILCTVYAVGSKSSHSDTNAGERH
jgi:hypothetical protein